jgi:lysozyme family protein
MAEFSDAVNYVLINEGGLVDKRQDHGGITNFGITLPMLTSFRQRQCSDSDIINLTEIEAKRIYEALFWNKLSVSGLNQAIATAILDVAINNGQTVAIKLAQHCLPASILPDGIMGVETLNALDKANPEMFIYSYVGYLQDRYADLCINATNQVIFLKGWLRRSRRLFTLLSDVP